MKNTIKKDTGCLHCGKKASPKWKNEFVSPDQCNCHAWQCNKVLALIVWNDRYSVFDNLRKEGSATDKELSPCPTCQSPDIEFISDGQYAYKIICKSCGYNK